MPLALRALHGGATGRKPFPSADFGAQAKAIAPTMVVGSGSLAENGGMPRPARALWVKRNYARRRHRSWMLAMSLASLGWGTWWVALFLRVMVPSLGFGLRVPGFVSVAFALCGLVVVLFTLRAKRSWLWFTLIPLFANASLLLVPWFASRWLAERG